MSATPSALSPRLERLKTRIMQRRGSFPAQVNPLSRAAALWMANTPGRSRVQVRAAWLHELVKLAVIEIEPDWQLAGNHLPTAHLGLTPPDPANAEHDAQLAALGVAREYAGEVRDVVGRWTRQSFQAVGELRPDPAKGNWGSNDSRTVYWGGGWVENHSIRDYAKVLRLGFAGIRREIEAQLAAADRAAPDFPQAENFWLAGLSICDAGILLGRRYAAEARCLAAVPGVAPAEVARLRLLAEACERVPAEGARSFPEAIQALWLAHVLTCGEDGINANSLGRLDQILYPYYAADLAARRLDRGQAREWLEELACRLYLEYDVQAIVLGGCDAQGRDAVNDLSYLFLEATRNVGVIRDLSVRLHRASPPDFIQLVSELIAQGGGIPFLFNDDCFLPALTQRGIALADARDYAPIGCIELTIPGRANPHAVSGWFNSAKCLELALFDGQDPRTGEQLGPRTGAFTACPDFPAFLDAYRRQVADLARRMVYHCNRGELAQREGGPLPCWSILTDDCIRRGRDITDGGAVYHYHSICFLGTANTADSLAALKKLVFETPQVDRAELLAALRDNFQGHESLRQMLLARAPKYGNDQAEVDELACLVASDFIDLMDTMRSPLGGRYFVHLFSFLCNIGFGKTVGATPDGRLAGEPLAYSLSAHQGRDVEGVTAMLNSLARLPHRRAAGASAAIIDLDPQLVKGAAGVRTLAQLIATAIGMGIGQLQWNVTTAERLRQAQADPERYGNIPVRVAGYSQLFRLVAPELQEHLIARTKHRR